jgi:hypothetical protein
MAARAPAQPHLVNAFGHQCETTAYKPTTASVTARRAKMPIRTI